MKLKRWALLLLGFFLAVSLTACKSSDNSQANSSSDSKITTFKQAVKTSKGKTVTFYGFGGDEKANLWVDQVVAPAMKQKYDITVKRVPMDIDNILNKLMTEKEADAKQGNIDVIWINGENFYTARQANLLYGPFASQVPSFNKWMNPQAHDSQYDFGLKINGYEVPYGTAQLVFGGDTRKFPNGFPTGTQALLNYAKANPGKITYTAPPEFTGSAFVRNVICDIVGYDKVAAAPANKAALYKVIKPGLTYLNEIKPYLWQQGKTYPTTTAELDQMFASGQINMTYSYSQMHVASERADHTFNSHTESFLWDKGTIANQNYLAIAKTSKQKDAALVLINEMTSEQAQLKKAESKYGYGIPPFDANKISDQAKQQLTDIYQNKGVPSLQALQSKQIPEVQSKKVAIIEDLWKEYVLHD